MPSYLKSSICFVFLFSSINKNTWTYYVKIYLKNIIIRDGEYMLENYYKYYSKFYQAPEALELFWLNQDSLYLQYESFSISFS